MIINIYTFIENISINTSPVMNSNNLLNDISACKYFNFLLI